MPNIDSGPSPASSTFAVHTGQPAPVFEAERDDMAVFFTIGVVINIVMITAYFIWAYKQWKKAGTSNEGRVTRALRQAQDDRE